ncbi:hypothetical protein CHELA40_15150 [Chelatococcus asaccharovorans]|nr:hypothetical protein CHELA17_60470 [Chelatococcus asaccharovorans]CAH1681653.1 hypothetical protein CHELA40_15150 [Chelatococcus asaccharovorans]
MRTSNPAALPMDEVARAHPNSDICSALVTKDANVGLTRNTSKLLALVDLLNLTGDLGSHVRRASNVKFAPLVSGNEPSIIPAYSLPHPLAMA